MLYCSNPENNFQYQNEYYTANWWIQDCPPHNQCQKSYYLKTFCTHHFCPKHGQYQRIEAKNKILSLGEPQGQGYFTTLHYGTTLPHKPVSQARENFFDRLRWHYPGIAYVWRLHFVKYAPHLHMMLLVNTNSGIVNPISPILIKQLWNKSLISIGHPNPSEERIYCKPVREYKHSVSYLFQTNKALTSKEVPPKYQGMHWHTWGMNRGYGVLCTPC